MTSLVVKNLKKYSEQCMENDVLWEGLCWTMRIGIYEVVNSE